MLVGRLWVLCPRNFGSIPSRGTNYISFLKASRLTMEPIQPLIQWVPGTVFFWSKMSGHEAHYSPSSYIKIKDECSHVSTPPFAFVMCTVTNLCEHSVNV